MATTGRPREFVLEDALDRAVVVFWRLGYEGTRLDDLTTAMGINRPSLYNAFGNKEATFRLAVLRYADTEMAYLADAVAQPTARAAAARYLSANLVAITTPGKPPGCLTVQGGLTGGGADERRAAELLADCRAAAEVRLAQRLHAALVDGDLPRTERPADLARYLFTVTAGLAVQAAAGATRQQLSPVVDRTLSAFP
ncbi:TetR/AcrR family transcriptional regulator [Umezawaea endophytica]|uniref:TetR/AcrR family transcriptional regulator n=1 Tax=Umezawaea endophytica TaxID=1654476 RepID=A0A9X2VEP6_9PSEU|nr:TetR/AcrR family transcriptional regulator [Umezawaea endophytica]MCS7475256.1 TetR/AcrR family transcriptional regulator [Umezawaea endophytica]